MICWYFVYLEYNCFIERIPYVAKPIYNIIVPFDSWMIEDHIPEYRLGYVYAGY
jgi:hypothetical protein